MKKLFISFLTVFSLFVCFSFAAQSVSNPSYVIKGEDIKIFWTDNSMGGYMDINLQDPKTNDRLHFGEVKMSDQSFTYTKQWEGDQKVWIIPGDGGDQIKFTIPSDKPVANNNTSDNKTIQNNENKPTRTVITEVPKTGPSGSLIGVILATFIIFGGYIYIKKRADI